MRQRGGFVGENRASVSNGAAHGEAVFPRCDEAEFGQPADFRRKRTALAAPTAAATDLKPGVAIVSCNDGLRPVIMKLEATDEESKIDYEPVER